MSESTKIDLAPLIDELFQTINARSSTSVAARDLKLNLQKLAHESELSQNDFALTLLACARALESKALEDFVRAAASDSLATSEELTCAEDAAAMMGMLNRYYRFRHMIAHGQGQDAVDSRYKQAGLRMTTLAKPVIGKERFELLSLAVSVIHGCEMCVNAHEAELLKLGVSSGRVHDAVRLACIASGVATLVA